MKKTVYLSIFFLMLGTFVQAQSMNAGTSQGVKSGQATETVDDQGNNSIQTNEQQKTMNQGEETQLQIQEKNSIQVQDGTMGSARSEERKSEVAKAVQSMIQMADRNGGIGGQVKDIAQNQNQNQDKLEKSVEKIEDRGGFAKFFVGPNYGEIKDAQKILEQNREQIKELNQIKTQLSNEGDQQQLMEQIRILEQNNLEIENFLNNSQNGFSLFGWLNKLLS